MFFIYFSCVLMLLFQFISSLLRSFKGLKINFWVWLAITLSSVADHSYPCEEVKRGLTSR